MSFTLCTSRWHDAKDFPDAAGALITPLAHEHFIGLHHVDLVSQKNTPAWILLSTHRVLIIRDQGRSLPSLKELHVTTLGKSENRFSRDTFDLHGEPYIIFPTLIGRSLRELLDLALLPPTERTLLAATLLIAEEELYHDASTLLETAQLLATPAPDEDVGIPDVIAPAPEETPTRALLSPTERILMWRAKCAIAIGAQGAAIDHLVALTTLRPLDDLIETTSDIGQKDVRWWLPIALAHEEADDMQSAAAVYDLLFTMHPAHHGFLLSQARCLKHAMRTVEAITAYTEYLAIQTASSQAFLLTPTITRQQADVDEETQHALDTDALDFAHACEELGDLYAKRAEWRLALDTYLLYIQHDPFVPRGYALLLDTLPHLSEDRDATTLIAQAMLLLRLLDPSQYQHLTPPDTFKTSLIEQTIPPHFSEPLSREAHDTRITHPGERMRSMGAQKWLSGLMVDRESTRDIERHCQRLSLTSHEVLFESLSRLAEFLSIPTPRCYLSHGMTGIQVHGEDNASEPALMLLGAAHLDPAHPQYLTERQMVFAFATQLEHVRAGHLVLTSSEFWGAFRDRALSGGIALLSLIPVGSALGKFADGLAGPLIEQLKKGLDHKLFASLVKYIEKQVDEGATHNQIQGAYESTIGALLLSERRASKIAGAQNSLVKEQLADFARCAMYTADRFGLLASDSLEDAVQAILLLSSYHADVTLVQRSGLRALLQRTNPDGELLHEELAIRYSELFKFALSTEYVTLKHDLIEAKKSTNEKIE